MKNRSLDEAGEWMSPQICFFENWEARERAKRAPEEKKLKEAQLNELKFDSEDLPSQKIEQKIAKKIPEEEDPVEEEFVSKTEDRER